MTKSDIDYRPDIDGLRAIAIAAVVGFHAFPEWIRGGFIGVDIFFVISGFLISDIILQGLEQGNFSFATFYARRVRRIFPALIIILVTYYAFGYFELMSGEYPSLGRHIAASAEFIANFMFWDESGYFDQAAESKPLLHLWSLGIEAQFYLIWPLLLWGASKLRLNFLIMIGVIVAASFACNMNEIYSESDMASAFYLPQSRFWELAIGALAYGMLTRRGKISTPQHSTGNIVKNLQSLAGALLIIAGLLIITKATLFPGWYAWIPTLGATLLISAGPQAWINRIILSRRPFIGLGLISYPLYVWHWPLLSFAYIIENGEPSWEIRIFLICVAVALATLTYVLVEKPIRSGRYHTAKTMALILSMALVCYVGYHCYRSGELLFASYDKTRNLFSPAQFNFEDNIRLRECHVQNILLEKHQPFCREHTRPLLALWGDSHAASLYPGFKKLQRSMKLGVTQLTQAGCPPIFDLENAACNAINKAVLNMLVEDAPDIIVLHAAWKHDDYSLTNEVLAQKFASTLQLLKQKLPTAQLIVIGPVPRWPQSPQRTIYLSLTKYDKDANRMPMLKPLEMPAVMQKAIVLKDIDRLLEKVAINAHVKYLSAIKLLCEKEQCISRVGDEPTDLIAVDYGHFSKAGAEFLVEKMQTAIFSSSP